MTTDMERVPLFTTVRDCARDMLERNGESTMEEKMVSQRGGGGEGGGQGGKVCVWGAGGRGRAKVEY